MKNLLKISLSIACAGLVLLLIISQNMQIPSKDLCDINLLDENKIVKINGTVSKVFINEKSTTIYLEECQKTNIFTYEPINISEGKQIIVTGKVSVYNNKTNLVAEKIEIQ